jgi:hypothetical protein
LSHSISPFWWWCFFFSEIGSHELFVGTAFEAWSFRSLLPEVAWIIGVSHRHWAFIFSLKKCLFRSFLTFIELSF